MPNVLRVLLLAPVEAVAEEGPLDDSAGSVTDELLIETNVDDLDPRVWPDVLGRLMAAGAVDAWLTPILMKKGRPAHTLSALVPLDAAAAVRSVVFTHTPALGLREQVVRKHALGRQWVSVDVQGQPVRVKQGTLEGRVVSAQPEYEDVLAAAEATGRPVKAVLADALVTSFGRDLVSLIGLVAVMVIQSPTMSVIALLVGFAVLVATSSSVLRNLVVPRRLRSKLTRAVSRAVAAPFRAIAYRSAVYERRDALLAWAAPMAILAILLTWLLLFLIGYALLIYAFSDLSWIVAMREAGSSLFTLGFASTDRGRLTAVDFAAAMTGPIVIGLQIGYLPALYGAYNRREAEVTMLDSRAGEPNWGPEILARHASVSSLDNLSELYRGWERWSADVSESHSNYPVLIYFRSQQASRNWLIGLLSVMDSAALTLAFNPSGRQGEARMALRMGFVCLRDLADTVGLPYDEDPDPDDPITLSYDEFLLGVERLGRRATAARHSEQLLARRAEAAARRALVGLDPRRLARAPHARISG